MDSVLPPPTAIVLMSDLERARAARYFLPSGERKASSRLEPWHVEIPEGAWLVDDILHGLYGHSIEVLESFDPQALTPTEFSWKAPDATMERQRLPDVERYVQWLREGHQPPPISVVEAEDGQLRVTDGHRRLLAAARAGRPVLAWLSPLTAHPQGLTDSNGRPMRVPLTWELATGEPWVPPEETYVPNRKLPRPVQRSLQPPKRPVPTSSYLSKAERYHVETTFQRHLELVQQDWQRTTLANLEAVFMRGKIAGQPARRLGLFLYLLRAGHPRLSTPLLDCDLLPPLHPLHCS